MKPLLISMFLASAAYASDGGTDGGVPQEARRVEGVAQSFYSYCGGRKPPEEVLAKVRAPRIEVGLKLLVRAGEVNDVNARVAAEATVDAKGQFSLQLKPGTWCIVEDAKRTAKAPATSRNLDEPCFKRWVATCDAVVKVGKAHRERIKIDLRRGCGAPCTPPPRYP